ncbi:MAG: efflux RND transporter periplasmic adaptor subunit [Myxococcota bacterium]
MRRWLPSLILLLVGLAVVLRFTVLRPDLVPVKVAPAEIGRVEATVTNSKAGTIRARRRADLSAEVGGRVVELLYREGNHVVEGDILVRLADATPKANLALAEQGLRVSEAHAKAACIASDRSSRELARKRTLADRDVVSADILDELQSVHRGEKASCNALLAEVDRAQARITQASAELAKYSVRAPFDGVIAEQNVEVGEWVTPSPPLLKAPAIIDILDPASIYVSAPMDEVDSAKIRAGQRASITVDSRPGQSFPGRVARVAPYVLDYEAQNRTVEIEVEFGDQAIAAEFLPGTSADVEVVQETRERVLRIPATALLEGPRVLVPNDGVLEERSVQTGLRNWNYAEVRSGLEDGDLVVVTLDREEVQAGARVQIENGKVE